MKRLLVCSDIHGDIQALRKVLAESGYNSENDQLVLLGDYIDRGEHSKEVVELVIKLVEKGAIALKGNHEEMLFNALEDVEEWGAWVRHIGRKTLDSYNGDTFLLQEHADWMKERLKLYHETEKYIFVHAGLAPDVPLEWQDEYDMLWSKHYELVGLGKIIVHGHTPVEEVTQHYDQLFIDTGCVFGNKLTLLELPSMRVYES